MAEQEKTLAAVESAMKSLAAPRTIAYDVIRHNNQIVIKCGGIMDIGLEPDSARTLAQMLLKEADAMEKDPLPEVDPSFQETIEP